MNTPHDRNIERLGDRQLKGTGHSDAHHCTWILVAALSREDSTHSSHNYEDH